MASGWLHILDQLFAGSWNSALGRHRSPFAFRGLASDDHAMTSTLVRLARGRADVHRLEHALLRNFRKYARADSSLADSIWDWLALGQHRGLPTRLLDWSYSPLVALHFVTEDPLTFNRDGVVWCVNFVEANRLLPRKLRDILRDEGSDTFTVEMLAPFRTLRDFDALGENPFVAFVEPPALDQRILNQFALFSLMSDAAGRFDEWMAEHPELCRRVDVPAALKWEIRDMLDQSNVNERVLFPGLDGLSRWLTRYYTPMDRSGSTAPPDRGERAQRVSHASGERAGEFEERSPSPTRSRAAAARDKATSRSRSPASRRRSGGSRRG